MKRFGNLYTSICDMENLLLADIKARRYKGRQKGIKEFDKDREGNLLALHDVLVNGRYETSSYRTFTIYEPKERLIYMLPYKDRIVHHAVMNKLEGILVPTFTADTYSCVKGKGTHRASNALKVALKDRGNAKYYMKLDVKKFYPSVDHEVLKRLLRTKLKDANLLQLLDGIIDSADGLPIGNYLSQYFANFYMTGFDHWVKERMGAKYYLRYSDDMVILAADKPTLHQLLHDIRVYLRDVLKLELKYNYMIAPVTCGIDFVGYIHYPTYTRVRKTTKQRCARKLRKGASQETIAAYKGCFKHADCKHLIKKLFNDNDKLWRNEYRSARKSLCG